MIQDDIGQSQRNVAANMTLTLSAHPVHGARLDQKCLFIHSHAVR